MTSSKGTRTDSSKRGPAVPIALCIAAVLLALPEALLARHDFGRLSSMLTLGSDVSAVCAGILLRIEAASAVLSTRPRSRRTIGFLVIVSLAVGSGVLALANLVPPPFSTSPFLRGLLTVTGVLDAVYIVGLLGAGAAALRFTASYLRRSARRTSP